LEASAASIRSLLMPASNRFHTGAMALRHWAMSSLDSFATLALPASSIS
jgi:hypothetical protein